MLGTLGAVERYLRACGMDVKPGAAVGAYLEEMGK